MSSEGEQKKPRAQPIPPKERKRRLRSWESKRVVVRMVTTYEVELVAGMVASRVKYAANGDKLDFREDGVYIDGEKVGKVVSTSRRLRAVAR